MVSSYLRSEKYSGRSLSERLCRQDKTKRSKLSVLTHYPSLEYTTALYDDFKALCAGEFSITVVVDLPSGFALNRATLENRAESGKNIVLTHNTCTEYLLDLLDEYSLVAREIFPVAGAIENALAMIAKIDAGDCLDQPETQLTVNERIILRMVAAGHSTKEVAQIRSIDYGTVRNVLSVIYAKLELRNQVELIRYYYDISIGRDRDCICF